MPELKEKKMSPSAKAGSIIQNEQIAAKKKADKHKKKSIKLVKPPELIAKEEGKTKKAGGKAPQKYTPKHKNGAKANGGKAKSVPLARAPFSAMDVHIAKTVDTPPRTSEKPQGKVKKNNQGKLKVFLLGGLGEIGKNMTVLEYENDMIVIDAGLAFPDEDMPGVDLVIPDTTYLENNVHKIRGILLTHGHEDHIGALPYVLQKMDVPVYATRMTVGILSYKIREAKLTYEPTIYTVNAGDSVKLGRFTAEFIHVNHSIADACAIAVKTPVGTVFHTGDFKLDVSPIDGQIMDLPRLGQLGDEGVMLLLGESTNAERGGFTPSERSVGDSFDQIFLTNPTKRIVVATFSSNVHRVQQIINTSIKYGRKVAVLGRSMVNVIGAAIELGYMNLPEGTLIEAGEIRRYKPEQITLITTGSQGEPMSALYRLAFGEHDRVHLTTSDLVVLSASAIPGNEKLVGKIVNALVKAGVKVVNDRLADVHVSGHACSEELKLMMALLRPKYFIPIHGENRHLYAHKEIAEFMGIPSDRIFLPDLGSVIEFDGTSAYHRGSVPWGRIFVDGTGVGDVGSQVLRDRKLLAESGLIVVVAAVDMKDKLLLSPPEIVSRGFIYMKESEDLMEEARMLVAKSIDEALYRKRTKPMDLHQIRGKVRDDLSKFFFKTNKRSPVIVPMIMEL